MLSLLLLPKGSVYVTIPVPTVLAVMLSFICDESDVANSGSRGRSGSRKVYWCDVVPDFPSLYDPLPYMDNVRPFLSNLYLYVTLRAAASDHLSVLFPVSLFLKNFCSSPMKSLLYMDFCVLPLLLSCRFSSGLMMKLCLPDGESVIFEEKRWL